MKIVLVSNLYSGILGFRKDLIIKLVGEGHEVYALATNYDHKSRAAVSGLGATPIDYQVSRASLNPFSDLNTLVRLVRIFNDIKPDVVFSFFMKPVIYSSIAAKITKVPINVSMIEGLGYAFTPEPPGRAISFRKLIARNILKLLLRVSFKCADRVLLLNADDISDLQEMCGLPSHKAYNLGAIGLNLDEYPFVPLNFSSPTRFVFVGRLLSEKGVKYFLEAARLCKQRNSDLEFLVLGALDDENPESISQDELQSYIDDDTIIYPGHVDDVNKWVASSHVFVLPSYYREGVPRSSQEAMSVGRPIITTNLPGCKETVVEGYNGYFVDAWDSRMLAEKMLSLASDRDLMDEFSLNSRKLAVEKFDVNEVNAKLCSYLFRG